MLHTAEETVLGGLAGSVMGKETLPHDTSWVAILLLLNVAACLSLPSSQFRECNLVAWKPQRITWQQQQHRNCLATVSLRLQLCPKIKVMTGFPRTTNCSAAVSCSSSLWLADVFERDCTVHIGARSCSSFLPLCSHRGIISFPFLSVLQGG